jgi:hypothetical protein
MNYGVNVLAPTLLVMELLDVLDGGIVLNMAGISHSSGTVDYFHDVDGASKIVGDEKEGKALGVAGDFRRYGSSKLLFTMIGYELRRRLDAVSILKYKGHIRTN